MTTTSKLEPVDGRDWWPEAYIDEVMPHGRQTPSAWLCRLNDGAHAYGDPADGDYSPTLLTEGETVAFICCDRLGKSRLSFPDDGDALWQPPVPADANHLWDGLDPDTICDTAEMYAEMAQDFARDEPEHIVCVARWSDTVRFRFTAAEGAPRFEPVDFVPASPGARLTPPDPAQGDLLSGSAA